jgi:hypothetical protein
MIDGESVDFLFSMDSLVHCDLETMKAYIPEMLRVLSPRGRAFIHHSNFGASEVAKSFVGKRTPFWRAPDVSGQIIKELIEENKGQLLSQELTNWRQDNWLNDCFSIFCKKNEGISKTPVVVENWEFDRSVQTIRNIQKMYTPDYAQ